MPGQTLFGPYERVQVNYSLGLPGYKLAMECGTSCGGKSKKRRPMSAAIRDKAASKPLFG